MRFLGPLLPALLLALIAGCAMDFGLNRVAGLPSAPYDKGPTLTGSTAVKMVDPGKVDAVCRAMNAALPQRMQAPPLPQGQVYRECYDPWNDVGYVPLYPSKAEQERLTEHMYGHARGGTHDTGAGTGKWREASWARFYRKPANIFAEQPMPKTSGNVFRGR